MILCFECLIKIVALIGTKSPSVEMHVLLLYCVLIMGLKLRD